MDLYEWNQTFQNKMGALNKGHTWNLELDESIDPENPQPGWKKYFRKTIARFRCSGCGRSWPSNRVMVVFHMRLANGRGTVKVRPLRQECKMCDEAEMGMPKVDSDGIDTLLTNLVLKIRINCYCENLGPSKPYYRSIEVDSPHEPTHCEGCRLGVCTR